MAQRDFHFHTNFTRHSLVLEKSSKNRQKLGVHGDASNPSLSARIKKPVFRWKRRNTGFSVTYRKQFELQIRSRMCSKNRRNAHEMHTTKGSITIQKRPASITELTFL